MVRTVGSSGEKTDAGIRDAALDLIARRGYEVMSMRELAEAVGVQAAAIYRYFRNKEELLYALVNAHMEGLLASWRDADPGHEAARERLAAFVRNHVRYHIEHRHSTQIANLELRSLSKEKLTAIMKLRTAYEKELRNILRDGVTEEVFLIDDISLTAMAVIQMTTGVIVWFRPDPKMRITEVCSAYEAMTMRLVGAATRTGKA